MYAINDQVLTDYGTGIVRIKYRDVFEWFYKVEFKDGKLITVSEKQIRGSK